jgi:NADH-quinone oxidoreductase subunit A
LPEWFGGGRTETVTVIAQTTLGPYAAIVFVVATVATIAAAMMLLAHAIKPARKGPVKDSTYESGMPTIGDARGRFNIRFYIVAMLFLLFDVEVLFLWPWAPVFFRAAKQGTEITTPGGYSAGPGYLLAVMGVFLAVLIVGYAYGWRKGVFDWD